MSYESFRENLNLKLYGSKINVLRLFRVLSFLVSVSAVGALIFYYGFPRSDYNRELTLLIIKSSFGFYIFNYLVRFLYTFEPVQFLRSTWFECTLVMLLLIDAVSYYIFNVPLIQYFFINLGFKNFTSVYILFLQLYLLLMLLLELAKASSDIGKIEIQPGRLFILSFIFLILTGTGLLMLPEMTTDKQGASLLTALFTSTSASCVTGLIVVDTATYFSFKGQLVILMLIQIGGLSIISFAAFFAMFSRKGSGIRQQTMILDIVSAESLYDTKGLLRQIISLSILIEAIGTIVIFSLWDEKVPFGSQGEKILFSVFHAVSAFNNAGFSLFTNGLYEDSVRNSFILHLAIAVLIFFGSLGFSSIRDIFGVNQLRERLRLPWKRFHLSTRIALYSSIALIAFGAIHFYLLEKDNVLAGQKSVEVAITSIFQSVVTRTTGFNTVDFTQLLTPTLIMMIFLMFIGASSGSTGGGIKTSTFTIILLSAYATIRGKKRLELFRHAISANLIYKAFSIFLFSAWFVMICIFFLTITDPGIDLVKLAFEEVSAFGTVGLSSGITASLSPAGKMILIITMFIGRVGPLTLAFALSKKTETSEYQYPKEHFMVG